MFKVLVINGPNLNMLGKREPEIYGALSLTNIIENLTIEAQSLKIQLSHVQSNAEHTLIEAIHSAYQEIDFILLILQRSLIRA